MKKILCIFVAVLFSCGLALGANTVVRSGNVVHISSIDSDWLWSDTFPQYPKVRVVSIQFNGAAADDQCVIEEGSAAGPPSFDVTVESAYDQRYKLFGGARLRPVLDYSAGTYTAGSTIIIIFDLD